MCASSTCTPAAAARSSLPARRCGDGSCSRGRQAASSVPLQPRGFGGRTVCRCPLAPGHPQANDEAKHAAKVAGQPAPVTKRQPKGPRTEGFFVAADKVESITAIPYDILKVRRSSWAAGWWWSQEHCLHVFPLHYNYNLPSCRRVCSEHANSGTVLGSGCECKGWKI